MQLTVNFYTSAWRRGNKLLDWQLNSAVPGFELMQLWQYLSESSECGHTLGASQILYRDSSIARTLQANSFFVNKSNAKLGTFTRCRVQVVLWQQLSTEQWQLNVVFSLVKKYSRNGNRDNYSSKFNLFTTTLFSVFYA